MRITDTYGWAASPSFTPESLLEEFKLLLLDSTLTDIPAPIKNSNYFSGTFSNSYGIRGYRLIRDAILEVFGIDKDSNDISQYCDVQYPEAMFTSGNYKYSCLVTRIVDSKAADATNRVYYLIGTLRYYKTSSSSSNNENFILEDVILCESLGISENERNLSHSPWGKPFRASSSNYRWDFNLPIKESKIVSLSLSRLSKTDTNNTGYYLCNSTINSTTNMYLYSYSTSYTESLFNSSGSAFKVQCHIDDNGVLSLIHTSYNNVLNIKKTRFPDSVLSDIHSYTCITDVYNGRFGIYVKGSHLGGMDGEDDKVFSAYYSRLLPVMNTFDTLLSGPIILYSAYNSSGQLSSTPYVFGIIQTPYYITNSANNTHNFQAGQLLQGDTFVYSNVSGLILPWMPSVLWMNWRN